MAIEDLQLPGQRPRMPDRKPECNSCQDGGLLLISGFTDWETYEQIFERCLPCICDAGTVWRRAFALRETPPGCAACGAPSTECQESKRPLCNVCWPTFMVYLRTTPGMPATIAWERYESQNPSHPNTSEHKLEPITFASGHESSSIPNTSGHESELKTARETMNEVRKPTLKTMSKPERSAPAPEWLKRIEGGE